MRRFARILLVVLGLLATLREAGSAVCASQCPGRPLEPTACTTTTCVPASCCTPPGSDEPVRCPLLEPTPQALAERAPTPQAFPESVVFGFFAVPPPPPLAADDFARLHMPGASSDRGVRTRAGPLWLLDLRLLI